LGVASSVYTNGDLRVVGQVTSTRFVSGYGSHASLAYGFSGYAGGFYTAGADLRAVTDDFIIRNMADSATLLRVTGSSITAASHFLPSANNALNIGAFGSAWANFYASGTAYMGTLTVTATNTTSTIAGTLVVDNILENTIGVSSTIQYATTTGPYGFREICDGSRWVCL
jgi:hypothetical protein